MAHWKKFFNKEFLGVWDLPETGKLQIKFTGFETREVSDPNGSKKIVFVGLTDKKPIILNATNCNSIERITGSSDIEKWTGQTFCLVSKQVRAFGSVVDALRIEKAETVKRELTADELKEAIWNKVKGTEKESTTIEAVKKCKGNLKSLNLIYKSL